MTVAALMVAAFAIFVASPVVQITDHKYLLMASDSLVRHGTLRLDGLTLPTGVLVPGAEAKSPDYRIEVASGHYYHLFPVGSAILSAPAVGLARLVRVVSVDATGRYHAIGERHLDRLLAAGLMAFLAMPLYGIARACHGPRASAVLVAATMLGSQVASTASRGLWSHDWAIVLIAIAIVHLVRSEVNSTPLRPIWLGTLLAWAYFCRPTLAIAAVGTIGWLAWRAATRRDALEVAAVVGAWIGAFMLWSELTHGRVLPAYYAAGRLSAAGLATGLAGNLWSPSRGTLVFEPWLVWLGWQGWTRRRELPARGLGVLAGLVSVAHLLTVSAFPQWYGGHSYGARMTTDLVPWWFLIATLVLAAWRSGTQRAGEGRRRRFELAAGLALVSVAVVLNGIGMVDEASWRWNSAGAGIDARTERLWIWRDAQFLAHWNEPEAAP